MNDDTPPTIDRITVTAWHNIATDDTGRLIALMDGYQPGHPLVPVARWDVPTSMPPPDVLAQTFQILNVGHETGFGTPDPQALRYRARRNRSLSVGDVIQIGTIWTAIASVGFTEIPVPQFFAIDALRPGSISLHAGVPPVGPLASQFNHRDLERVLQAATELYQDTWSTSTPRALWDWQVTLLERLRRAYNRASADT